MSTRGCIARLKARAPPAFEGVYHHWDSYPSGLGQALYRLWNGHFRMNTEAMLHELIDRHPAGWSTVVERSFDQTPGFSMDERGDRPQCYCHGERSESGWRVTDENAAASGVEYAYAFDGARMLILGSFIKDGSKMVGLFGSGDELAEWAVIAEVTLDGPEPDWEAIDELSATRPPTATPSAHRASPVR